MNPVTITNIQDERIAAYRYLKDRQLAREQGLFVVEGEHLVRRLLSSRLAVHSVLMTNRRFEGNSWSIPATVQVYLSDQQMLSEVVGFDFHRGVLALGHRPEAEFNLTTWSGLSHVTRLLICPEINDVENLGSIMRSAAGLGFGHLLLGPSCCDPWSRRAIRTSMGTVFQLQLARSLDLQEDLGRLQRELGFQWHAAVLDDEAEVLNRVTPPPKVGLLLGSEADGLDAKLVALVHHKVTIPMALSTDSLNVGVAAGIFMHHYVP